MEKVELWKMQKGTLTMFIGEVIGTAVLIFVGCMGCVGTFGRSPPPPVQTALTFGFTVNMIIMMLGHISGAHLNPAVTIGSVIFGLKSIPTGAIYIAAQFLGAILGYGSLTIVTPSSMFNDGFENSTVPLCVTVVHPELSGVQAILIEAACTAIILCTACGSWDPRCAHTTDSTALRFGLAVAGISFAAVVSVLGKCTPITVAYHLMRMRERSVYRSISHWDRYITCVCENIDLMNEIPFRMKLSELRKRPYQLKIGEEPVPIIEKFKPEKSI